MQNNKGFSFIEIMAVMIIVAILATIAISNYSTILMNNTFQVYEHNLIAIASAEQSYYQSHGYYCGSSTDPSIPSGCTGVWNTSTQNINQALGLSLPLTQHCPPDPNYYCYAYPSPNPGFTCTTNSCGGTSSPVADVFFSITNNNTEPGVYMMTNNIPYCQHQNSWPGIQGNSFPCP